jgi:uncharacterized oxidoreductase
MSVETLAKHAITALKKDKLEITPGPARLLKLGSRIAPNLLLRQMNNAVDAMHAQTDR